MPTRGGKLGIASNYLWNSVLKGKPTSEMLSEFKDKTFLRPGAAQSAVEFTGWKPDAEIEDDALFVIAVNHDYAMFDLAAAQKISDQLGVEKPSILTVKRSWPHYKLREREPEVLGAGSKRIL